MDIRRWMGLIFFGLTIILVISLAPSIQTANNTAYLSYNGSTEKASMVGLGVIMPWGDLLIIISILVAAGLLSLQLNKGGGIKDVIAPVGTVIGCIILLNFYDSMITSFNTLIAGTTNAGAKIFYGAILLLIYLTIVGSAGAVQAVQYFRGRKKNKKASYSMTNP
jgi:hypothetical protein